MSSTKRRGRGAGSKGEQGLRREASTVSAEVQRDKQKGIVPHLNASRSKEWGIATHVSLGYTAGKKEHSPCSEAPCSEAPCSLLPCFLFKKTFRLLRVPQAVTPVTELISKMMYCIIFLFTLIYSLRRMHLC
jgi:hypothetical protein